MTPSEPAWLGRADRAFRNLMETFLPFAALVIVAHLAQRHDALTAQATVAYLAARVAHGVVYIAGIPWLRAAMFEGSLAANPSAARPAPTHPKDTDP